jgi:hypothetical protein
MTKVGDMFMSRNTTKYIEYFILINQIGDVNSNNYKALYFCDHHLFGGYKIVDWCLPNIEASTFLSELWLKIESNI